MEMIGHGPIAQRGSKQWGFDVTFAAESAFELSLYVFARQNENDHENFSCGIQMIQDGKKTMLSRYNGSNHENDVAIFQCHIHHSTVESINRGDRKPEHADTQITRGYNHLGGAVECLCVDYNITWVRQPPADLFGNRLR